MTGPPDQDAPTTAAEGSRPRAGEEARPPEPAHRARGAMVIAATPQQVFAVLSDGRRYSEWVVGAQRIESVDPEFPRPGSSFHPRIGVGPATTDGRTTVTRMDPGHRLDLLASVEPLGRARISFTLEAVPGGTLVVLEEEAVGDDVRAGAGRSATRAIRSRNGETLWKLKLIVEREVGAHEVGSSADPDAAVPRLLSIGTARLFAWASGLRNGRIFHPSGTAYSGTAHLRPEAVGLLADRPEVEVIARISRGIGLPHPLPDFNGVALRLVDAHGEGHDQDLLLVSAPGAPVARHVLLPVPVLDRSSYSSVLPYRTPEGLKVFGARALRRPTPRALDVDLPTTVDVLWASLTGPWTPIAEVRLTDRLEHARADSLRFDPWHTGVDVVPAGFLNRLRLPAYAASQAARRA